MTRAQVIRRIQQWLSEGKPAGKCEYHSRGRCVYSTQGQLIELHLCGLHLTQVPSEVWQRSSLQRLHLYDNQLSTLPEEIGQLTALQELDLGGNQLSTLPAEMCQLTALQKLRLCSNQFSTLPVEMCQITALQRLNLTNNQFSTLPVVVCQLTALQELNLSFNQFSTLPVEMCQLTALQELDLSVNRLSTLPAVVCQLTALQRLNLMSTQLRFLPEEIGQLTALQRLSLWNNQVRFLPATIGQLTALQELDLSFNQVRFLPEEIGQLTTLQKLSLYNNQLRTLPAEVCQLTALQELNLDYNQLQSPLPELIDQGIPTLLDYLRKQQQVVAKEVSGEERVTSIQASLPVKIFYCYAQEDEQLLKKLQKHLAILKHLKQAISWHDREILAGSKWEHEVETHLDAADIILLLMSAAFIASDYCYNVEMQRALERHRRNEAHVIPIVLSPCSWKDIRWQEMSMSDLQALPKNGKPITKWPNRNEAWNNVTEGVKGVVERCFSQKVRPVKRDQISPKKQKQMDTVQDPQQQEWFKQLRRGLAAGSPGERAQAAHGIAALANFSDQPVREALKGAFQKELREALHDPSDRVRRAARLALEEFGENEEV